MPLSTNLNVSPYYDDYDANNQYYRILFRPGTAVQARELTQVQSILQNQIESFGNWAFQNGDVVSGCSISDIPQQPFVYLADAQTNSAPINLSNLVNTQLVSVSSNLQARVIATNQGLAANYPNTNILYIKYLNTGTSGQTIFSPNETLDIYNIPASGIIATINTFSNSAGQVATGNAHGITVSEGVVYLSGEFVKVLNPTFGIVNAYGTQAGNSVVGFQLVESIVTENQDPSLLDNALGYSNENAPGAHRLKLIPTLVALDPETASETSGFNPIAKYSFGSLVSKTQATSNLYSIVGDAIAQRIYEEAGNYVVNPFVVDTISTLPSVTTINSNAVLGRVSPGVGYAEGSRVELLKTAYIPIRRGVDTQVYKQAQITFNYGGYYTLNEVSGTFPFTTAQSVDLYNTAQGSVTNRTFGLTSPSGTKIGNAQIRCFSFNGGNPGTNTASYNLHLFNIKLANGYNTDQVKSVYYGGTTPGVGDVTSNGLVSASTKDQLYTFGTSGLKNLRDAANNNNTEYVYRTVNTSATMLANGYTSVTLAASATGGVDILPYGNTGSVPLNSQDGATFILIAQANSQTTALPGTVAVTTTANTVTGTGTYFTNNFSVGNILKVGTENRIVTSVSNNTYLSIDVPFSVANASANYYEFLPQGKIIPIYETGGTGQNGVYITNSTNFSIHTNFTLSGTTPVTVMYDVLRTSVVPASKVIKKDRFVKIQANTNGQPLGPYCLGYSDVHQVKKIYGSADGSYTTSGVDLTSAFSFDPGQKDTHYGYGYIYPTGAYNPTAYPYLLVQLDYFAANTSAGSGFFTVESYPIDDANTANTNAIQTRNIPLYVDESGTSRWLRDYIDFRIPSVPTANDTGVCNTSNATSVTTAISYASVNPSNSVNLSIPAGGLNTPSYGRNFQADYTTYLPRKDLVLITPDTTLKIKEGLSSQSPQTPLYPDNAMALAVVNIPPYPSLASDEVDADRITNQNSISLIRDTSTAMSVSIVTNRRYTMRDIGKLDNRISDLEYYQSLTLLQQKAKSTSVTDANGLDRFKNGIFVDPFDDFTNSDVANPEYSIAIDSKKSIARPKFISEVINMNFNTSASSNWQKTGRVLSLPYSNTTLIQQPYATKYRSSAHVASAWNGTLTLMPGYSNNIDTNNTASVSITQNNATPWQQFANTPFGSIWGAWQTTSNVTSYQVQTGTANVYNYEGGYGANLGALIQQFSAQGYQIGRTTNSWYTNPLYPDGWTQVS